MTTADVPRLGPVFPGGQNLDLRQLSGPPSTHMAGMTLGPWDASVVGLQRGYHGARQNLTPPQPPRGAAAEPRPHLLT